jgi:hypothetical protein
MAPRRQSEGRGGRRRGGIATLARVIFGAVVIGFFGIAAYYCYYNRADLKRFFSTPKPLDAATLDRVVGDAYAKVKPAKISTSTVDLGSKQVRYDRLELPKKASLLRANYEITRAVEGAGGKIVYGVESSDEKGRKMAVTLAVSDGQSIVREIKLERGTK